MKRQKMKEGMELDESVKEKIDAMDPDSLGILLASGIGNEAYAYVLDAYSRRKKGLSIKAIVDALKKGFKDGDEAGCEAA